MLNTNWMKNMTYYGQENKNNAKVLNTNMRNNTVMGGGGGRWENNNVIIGASGEQAEMSCEKDWEKWESWENLEAGLWIRIRI